MSLRDRGTRAWQSQLAAQVVSVVDQVFIVEIVILNPAGVKNLGIMRNS